MSTKEKLAALAAVIAISATAYFGLAPGESMDMEFLVRLEDKVNTQVFCLNPVHKGNHMDRVFFDDNTFGAVCPECGENGWLYRKNNAISKKGHFITFKPAGWDWGTNERKHYGIVKINCTYEQAQEWCQGIEDEQAKSDVDSLGIAINSRQLVLVEAKATKLEMGNDDELLSIKESLRQAENRVTIGSRPRRYSFDFEQDLSIDEVANWKDKNTASNVIELNTVTMKESQ